MVNFGRMIATRNHSSLHHSVIPKSNPSRNSPKHVHVSHRRSYNLKAAASLTEAGNSNEASAIRKMSDEITAFPDRSRKLSQVNGIYEPINTYKRSKSTNGRLLSHRLEGSRLMKAPQEMMEIISPPIQNDLRKVQPPNRLSRTFAVKRRTSTSIMTISRGDSQHSGTPTDLSPMSPPEVGEFMDMITKPIPIQRTRNNILESSIDEASDTNSSVFVASPPTNPDHVSPPPRLRVKAQKTSTADRNCISYGYIYDPRLSSKSSATMRQRLGQKFARSTPDINMEIRQANAKGTRFARRLKRPIDKYETVNVERLQNRLRSFESGKLPQIPPELLDCFPQNLPAHDFTAIERMWNQLTSSGRQDIDSASNSSCRKNKDQQLSAIMELLHTEACYIKTLEMIINVHIAVYLDLTKSTVPNSTYNPSYRGGSLNRLVDPIIPTEPAHTGTITSGVSSGTNSTSIFERIRRIRGRGGHDYSNSNLPTASSSSSLSNLSSLTLSEPHGFSAPPVEEVFGNIGAVYRANHSFWKECFGPGIINEENLDVKYCLDSMKKAFSKFRNYFEPYAQFLENYNALVSNIRYLDENSKFFSIYHEWTKANNTLNSRESLTGLLAQPFQRLTRYGILIKRIKEATTDEDEIAALTEMIEAVDDFVKEVDVNQLEQEAKTKLNDFIHRIQKYTFADTIRSDFGVDMPAVSTDIACILRQPLRINGRMSTRKPIAEVQAKVKFVGGRISDALCVLLSDMILICKLNITKRHLNVIRPPIYLTYLTIQQRKDNPDCYVGMIRNDHGLLVDCYSFSSDDKDLEEWISKVCRQRSELISTPRQASLSREVYPSFSYAYLKAVSVPDGSSVLSQRHPERLYSSDYHPGITCGRFSSRRNSENVWQLLHNTSGCEDLTVIARPQQLLDGSVGLFPPRSRRKSILPITGDHGDIVSPASETNSVDKMKSEACLKSLILKSASSASDSSNNSNSMASSANTTSGDSFGGWALETPGSVSGVSAGIPPIVNRNSIGRAVVKSSELLKTDAAASKR